MAARAVEASTEMSKPYGLYLEWYVKNVETLKDGKIAFLVASVLDPSNRFTVYRDDTVWHCPCDTGDNTPTPWIEGQSLAGACQHIARAYSYHRSMLKRAEEMKQAAKAIAEENKRLKEQLEQQKREASPTIPLGAKRKIRLD